MNTERGRCAVALGDLRERQCDQTDMCALMCRCSIERVALHVLVDIVRVEWHARYATQGAVSTGLTGTLRLAAQNGHFMCRVGCRELNAPQTVVEGKCQGCTGWGSKLWLDAVGQSLWANPAGVTFVLLLSRKQIDHEKGEATVHIFQRTRGADTNGKATTCLPLSPTVVCTSDSCKVPQQIRRASGFCTTNENLDLKRYLRGPNATTARAVIGPPLNAVIREVGFMGLLVLFRCIAAKTGAYHGTPGAIRELEASSVGYFGDSIPAWELHALDLLNGLHECAQGGRSARADDQLNLYADSNSPVRLSSASYALDDSTPHMF